MIDSHLDLEFTNLSLIHCELIHIHMFL